MAPEQMLAELGLTLPTAPSPVAAYVPVRRLGRALYVSGQIPVREGKPFAKGIVGRDVDVEVARTCAEICTLNGLAAARAFLEGENRAAGVAEHTPEGMFPLAHIAGVIRVGCFVACTSEFNEQSKVANAASELLIKVFGESGRHARAAVGAPSLPLGVPVEVEFVFETR